MAKRKKKVVAANNQDGPSTWAGLIHWVLTHLKRTGLVVLAVIVLGIVVSALSGVNVLHVGLKRLGIDLPAVPVGDAYAKSVQSAREDGRPFHVDSVVHHLRIEVDEDTKHLTRNHRLTYCIRVLADSEEALALDVTWTPRANATSSDKWHGSSRVVGRGDNKWNVPLDAAPGELVAFVTGWETSVPVPTKLWNGGFGHDLKLNQEHLFLSPEPDSAAIVTLIVESDSLALRPVPNGAERWLMTGDEASETQAIQRNPDDGSGIVDSLSATWTNVGPEEVVRLVFEWEAGDPGAP